MDSTFEYFFQAEPSKSMPMYALYDVMDKHFMLQSTDYTVLHKLMIAMRSKTNLEMAVLPYKADMSNANIEKFYIKNLHPKWMGDLVNFYKQPDPEKHLAKWAIVDPEMQIELTQTHFDSYKTDLQKQLFFFYYCLSFLKKHPSDLVEKLITNSIWYSKNYSEVVDCLLNSVAIHSQQDRAMFHKFLTQTGLFYE